MTTIAFDQIAMWLGCFVLGAGGALLALMLVGIAAWACVEWWYRRYCNLKVLHEFLKWKRNRVPG